MGHRTVKRVPLDFDAPLNEVWAGYVMPDEIRPAGCGDCGGTGYSPTARWLHDTFYNHYVSSPVGGWNDKLVQADVDALVEAGRLRHLVKREPTEGDARAHWVTVRRTAEEVNAAQHKPGALFSECGHDGINVSILVGSRCERLGTDAECARCKGRGMVCSDEEYERYDNWMGTEPPEGPGWQLWETISEGSPQSPVFASPTELAAWCEGNATWFANERWTAAEWLTSFDAGMTDVDSLLVVRVAAQDGVS